MADVHNVKHINQLDVTFSTEMKGRHSLTIAAVFYNQGKFTLTYKYSEVHYFLKIRRNALLTDLERGIILAFQNILFLHISKII